MYFPSLLTMLFLSLGIATKGRSASPKAPTPQVEWLLPDQKVVGLLSEPGLDQKKLSRLTLVWPTQSQWQVLEFDAIMPEHKHGMIVKPSAPEKLDSKELRYDIRGVKLHMAGLWQLRLRVKNAAGDERWLERPFPVPF